MSETLTYWTVQGDREHSPPFCYAYETKLEADLAAYAHLWEHREELLTNPWYVAQRLGVDKDLVRLRLCGPITRTRCYGEPAIKAPAEVMILRRATETVTVEVESVTVTQKRETVKVAVPWTAEWPQLDRFTNPRGQLIVDAHLSVGANSLLRPPPPETTRCWHASWYVAGERPEVPPGEGLYVRMRTMDDYGTAVHAFDACLRANSEAEVRALIEAVGFDDERHVGIREVSIQTWEAWAAREPEER